MNRIKRIMEWFGFWMTALLSLPEWRAEEREIQAEEEEIRLRAQANN